MNVDYGRNVANDDQVREWVKALRGERALADDLAAELKMARDDVADWSMYADEYFREKHNLAGDLARIDAALARYQEARQR